MYMYVILVGIFVLAILLFIVALKLIRVMLKVLLMATSVIMIAVVILGFVMISDISDIKQHLGTDTSLILIEENGSYVRGLRHVPDEELEPIGAEEIAIYNDMTLDEILGSNYKIVIFTPAYEDLEEEINIFSNPLAFIKTYKEGNIIIYPELRTTRLLSYFPTNIIQRIIK